MAGLWLCSVFSNTPCTLCGVLAQFLKGAILKSNFQELMKKYIKIVGLYFGIISTIALQSCSLTRQLHPVRGPLAQQGVTSIPIKAVFTGSGHGSMSAIFPDGEICKGRYSTISNHSTTNSYGSGYTSYGISPYGSNSIYSGNSMTQQNQQNGQAVLIGNKGRIIRLQYSTSANSPTHGHGEGHDNRGNSYTMVY